MRFCLAVVASLLVAALAGVGHASAGGDPDLEPGFPVQTFERAARTTAGRRFHVQVGNIDADPTLEILATALSVGPLYAWNADGSTQPGWPLNTGGAAYPAMGELSASDPGFEVFAASWDSLLFAVNGAGASRFPAGPGTSRTTSTRRRAWATWTGTASTRSSPRSRTGRCTATGRTARPPRLAGQRATAGRSSTRPRSATSTATGFPRSCPPPGSTTPGCLPLRVPPRRDERRRLPASDQHGVRPRGHVPGDRRRRRRRRSGDRRRRPRRGSRSCRRNGTVERVMPPVRRDLLRQRPGARRSRRRRRSRDRRADERRAQRLEGQRDGLPGLAADVVEQMAGQLRRP